MSFENLKYFETLSKIDVSEKISQKGKFDYLSWTYAVEEMTKVCPDWTYEIECFNNLPYVYDEKTGYMVFTNITAFGIKKKMWLPVMDFQNKAKKNADIIDINKTIMRCLVKNIAMFGLGLYIFAGEDLPEEETKKEDKETSSKPKFETKKEDKETSSKLNFENIKQKLLSSNNINELRQNWILIQEHKIDFTADENKELENIKNTMKNELEKI